MIAAIRRDLIRTAFVTAVVAGLIVLFATASANGGASSPWYLAKAVHLKGAAATAFTVRVVRPQKIVLYPEAAHVSTSVVCVRGVTVSHLSRDIVGETTRNLLWHVPGRRFDECYVMVAAAQSGGRGYVSVQAMVRAS